jgi:hypothetical protein
MCIWLVFIQYYHWWCTEPWTWNIGICFAVGCTASWSWQNIHGLLLSYYCGAGVTFIVHFCHELFAINMVTPNLICTKVEKRAVIHFCGLKVYQVSKCIEWCQCSMGTVSCHNGLSVNGARSLKMVAQALSMGKEPDANPHPLLLQTLPTLLKNSRNWTLRHWSFPCIVLTLHLQPYLFCPLPFFF